MQEKKVFPKEPVQFNWSGASYSGDKVVTMHRLLAEKMEAAGKGKIVESESPAAKAPEKKPAK